GGGICIGDHNNTTSTDVTISNCIISGNHVGGDYPRGGGIATFNEPILSVNNTLFWNNTLEDVSCDDPWLCVNVTKNNNLDSCDAYGNLTLDPLFVSPGTENFSLESGSPCIDAGSNSFVTTETDFLHNYRIWDGNHDNDSVVDMGAYEYDSEFNSVGITENDLKLKKAITIFPNPTSNYLNIDVKDVLQVEVYNNSGCFKFKSSQSKIDISNLKPGVYFLKIIDKKQNFYSSKILKY
ncbi:MAG: T9SS type A sorting domain-containing protein, partial [Bacteroidales bacterium]|nr:T9SS type A sorting domain-containing protein [Bacteroidales bacterium]